MSEFAYLLLVPAVWCVSSWALAHFSGWSQLARQYAATGPMHGPTARMRSGRVGVVNYYSSLNFCVTEAGLGISVVLPLRLGHPPLLVPWDDIHRVCDEQVVFSHRIGMSLGNPTIARVVFPGWVKFHMPRRLRPS